MTDPLIDRDVLAFSYLETLPFEPYPFQEEAILAWFDSEQGLLVSAPTGMGKTVIAEAGLYEALHTKKRAYYTTPLIALTEQKYHEIQAQVERWGFSRHEVGLVTGNRRENPDAKILVVVAEILFNRLLAAAGNKESATKFSFDEVSVVVMDEFHQFSDHERGIVWEFSLELLPPHVRTLLISATVGNAYEFIAWLRNATQRRLTQVTSDERKVPLTYLWIGDKLLPEHLEAMHEGDEESRMVPALVFCFNRDQCWDTAEIIKGKNIIDADRQKRLAVELEQHDWSRGGGPKLKQLLIRGIGVHHAGILPKYRRIIETLFQKRLLSIAVCTETLAAGINLPARSVVLPTILKGPHGEKKLIDSSTAHQIFGRAGRPQFDNRGFVFALAHPDDVKIGRFREKYDQIPDDTKDPKLREAKKKLKKKMPTRSADEQYWVEEQFVRLQKMSPGALTSRGPIPWRMLAHLIETDPDLSRIRRLVAHRLMGAKRLAVMQKSLDVMLLTLWRGGFIRLEPNPADFGIASSVEAVRAERLAQKEAATREKKEKGFGAGIFDNLLADTDFSEESSLDHSSPTTVDKTDTKEDYIAKNGFPTEKLPLLMSLRGLNPIYGTFLLTQLGIADRTERILAFESLFVIPETVARFVRVPGQNELPPGPLARERLDPLLLERGLATVEELIPKTPEELEQQREERKRFGGFAEERVFVLSLGEKLRRLFDDEFPSVPVKTTAVWAAGEILLRFGGDFDKFITSNRLQKQEGMIFRHLLRMILLLEEFRPLLPDGTTTAEWQTDLDEIIRMLVACCHTVDPTSTDNTLHAAQTRIEE